MENAAGEVADGHLAEFIQAMRAKGGTAKRVQGTASCIKAVIKACGFVSASELDAAKVSAHVDDLKREGAGARAINARLAAFKSFTRWLFRTEQMRTDPMMQVAKLNAKADKRHQRRALSNDELARLLAAAAQGPVVLDMSGPVRAMLYRLAAETGLRAGENWPV